MSIWMTWRLTWLLLWSLTRCRLEMMTDLLARSRKAMVFRGRLSFPTRQNATDVYAFIELGEGISRVDLSSFDMILSSSTLAWP